MTEQRAFAENGSGSHPATISSARQWVGFGALMLGLFTILSASTSVSTAIPVIQRDLHANLTQVEWIVDSYLLSLTAFLTTFGRLGDLFGRKRMFLIGGVIFTIGSIACGLSGDTTLLIAFRALTGIGPAMMMPATLSLITDLFPPHKRGLPMGLWGSLAGVAIGLGPVVGGLLVSDVDWRWVFWSSAVLGLAAVAFSSFLLPASQRSGSRPSMDVPGLILNGFAIFSLTFGLIEGNQRGWTSFWIIGCFVLSAILFALFVVREHRARDPLVNLHLFRQPAFSAGILVTMALSFGILACFVFMPLFLQGPRHDTPLRSGLTLVPLSLAMAAVGPVGGLLANRVQPRWPIAGAMTLFVVGTVWLSHLTLSTTWQWLTFPFLVIGCGLGLSSANINTAVMHAVPSSEAGSAAGVVVTVRQLGSVLGVAIMGAVLQHREGIHLASALRHVPPHNTAARAHAAAQAFTSALNDTFLVCAAVLALGALLALLVRHKETDTTASVTKFRPTEGRIARGAE